MEALQPLGVAREGGHLLIGVAIGVAGGLLPNPNQVTERQLQGVLDAPGMFASMLDLLRDDIFIAMAFFFLFFLLRTVLRREWIAITAVMLSAVLLAALSGASITSFISHDARNQHLLYRPLGDAACCGQHICHEFAKQLPTDHRYIAVVFREQSLCFFIVLAMTAYGTYTALAGRPMFRAGLLDAD